MSQKRNYSYPDVDMLVAAKTIAQSFKANISELSMARTDWSDAYADELLEKINTSMDTYLGIDIKKMLREATAALVKIQMPAKRDLSFFKTQVDDDFKSDKSVHKEILNTLGFTSHLKDVQKGNQEALLLLLFTFKKNMTDTLKEKITSQGMNPALIEKILEYANTYRDANIAQENLKESTKEITKDITDSFNSIYDEIIGICKIASNYYQYEPLKKEQFTFSKAISNLGAARKIKEESI